MRRLLLLTAIVPLLTGCFYLPGGGWSDYGSADVEQAQTNVRASIPAIEAWYADHGTYAGLTVELLKQTYDSELKDITLVPPLNAKRYCVESTVGNTTYFKPGPGADILEGHCGDPVPAPAPPPPPVSYDAQTNLRAAIPAIEAWNADHGTYAGMTIEKLRAKYDYGIPTEVKIVRASKDAYCIESSVGGETYSFRGPGGPLASGRCY
jgi:hypothetical protein